jgi:hypothetical protein
MAIVDERGRLFGRFNLIDASVVVVVVLLLPIAYAGYVLFRPPPIRINSVTPNRVERGSGTRIRLTGEHLRPYLRAEVGRVQPARFLIESPTEGEIAMPDLEPGTYDIALFDETEEVARMKGAVTVAVGAPPPTIGVQLVGTFTNLNEHSARTVRAGQRVAAIAGGFLEVVSAASPLDDVRRVRMNALTIDVPAAGSWRVPATVRTGCVFNFDNQGCSIGGTAIVPGLALAVADGARFIIDEVRPDTPGLPMEIAVRFVGRPETLDLVKPGDVDVLAVGGGASRAARIVTVTGRQTVAGETLTRVLPGQQPVEVTLQTPDRVAIVDAVIRLVAESGADGPMYRGGSLKLGSFFTFDSTGYVARGSIGRSTHLSK